MTKIQEGLESNSVRRNSRKSVSSADIDYVTLASMTEGYSISDLIDLVGSATQQAMIRSTKSGDGHVSFD
jgi:peroxin-1